MIELRALCLIKRSRSPQTMPRLLQMHDSFRCKFKNRRKIRSVAISGELRPRSPSSTIVALSTTNLPILPVEVWELILDWLVVGYTPEVGQTLETNLSLRRDLSSCALVCRTWKIRAQMHLFAFLRISGHGLSQYEALLLKLPALCNSAKELKFYNRDVPDSEGKVAGRTIQTASHAVRIAHKLSNAHYLVMSGINLAVEHPHLARHMAALTQMTRLHFYSTTPTKLIQLARILTGLKHLSILILSFSIIADSNPLPLPIPCYATKSSLTKLELFIQPGGHLLVDWLVKARSFITSLQMLHVWLDCQIPQPEIALTTRCVQTFLDNCAGSLREYTTLANIRVDGLTTIPKGNVTQRNSYFLADVTFSLSSITQSPLEFVLHSIKGLVRACFRDYKNNHLRACY